ncbi:hypothetical protein Tco_1380992 [Tanacetum coccineum]
MAPKRTSTSAVPAMTQAAIKKLVVDSVAAALEAQAATMANDDNTNRNTEPRETHVQENELAVLCLTMMPNSEKLMEVFIGGLPRNIEGNVTALKPQTLEKAITITQRTFTNNNNYQNNRNNNSNRNNDHQQQQNRRQETIRAYAVTPTENSRSSDQELQKQRANHWKQPTTSNSNLSCLWRERALKKLVPKSKQQCPQKSILVEGQECSPRFERSHGYALPKPTSS